ncbi:hypothetical protein PFICI_12717 [Pestalotiopsis fici W106-1]|uniref:DUF2306 domain-containing protein n=1 Tax=Pestalotiopsis fici (strain W106-1 / CGMCC3.15140) TaxID=1229662 RepID=W3WPJ4_PESFW|nr:uncharacterized protein PFICI_12717 [Pestalotiopsis fici W106-1]ETS75773.1 hypothetical protein PFICI_12717 [Pestalotiopsis fici W106-1]
MSSAISLPTTAHNLVQRRTATPLSGKSHTNNSVTQLSRPQKTSRPDQWWLLSVPAFLIAAYAANFLIDVYRVGDSAIIDRIRSSLFGISHIVGGLTAMLLGPFQFLASIRRKYPKVHRWIGRLYALGILMGGINAFYVSFTSLCRPLGQYAFAFLGLIWLATAAMGMSTIWSGQVAQHRNWMARNFSLTYAAVMLRWQLPLFISLGMETEPALTLTGFTSWIPNLIFAEWWIIRQTPKRASD